MKTIAIIANVLFPGLGTLLVGKVALGIVQLLLNLTSLVLAATGVELVFGIALAIAVLIWSVMSVMGDAGAPRSSRPA